MYGKLVYDVGGKAKTRLFGPVWMCNLGNNALVRKVNHLAGAADGFTVSQTVKNNEKVLVFEMPKKLYLATSSFFTKTINNLNAEVSQARVLNHPDIKTIIFELSQKEFQSLKNEGKRYEYKHPKMFQGIINLFTKPFHNARIKKFGENLKAMFKTPEEQKWINEYLK